MRTSGLVRGVKGVGTVVHTERQMHQSARDRTVSINRTSKIYPAGHYAKIRSSKLVPATKRAADALAIDGLADPGAPCMARLMLFVSAVEKPENSAEIPAAGVDGESSISMLHRAQWMFDDAIHLLPRCAVGNEECRRLATNVYDLADTIRRQAAQANSEPPGREFQSGLVAHGDVVGCAGQAAEPGPTMRAPRNTPMQHIHAGKVRDLYELDGDIILVASDRVSVYDVTLPTPIPDKGALLTQLSAWWFNEISDVVPNHVVSTTDVPAEFGRNAVRCKPLDMIPVECIARGYLAGLGLREYQKYGTVSGVPLPSGLVEGSRLPEPIFTPTTKFSDTGHDEFITFDDVVNEVGKDTAERLRALTIEIYQRGAARAEKSGIIIADTKFEFGRDAEGTLTLGDEVLTSDSSRFWPADQWEPGRPQYAFDKQFVRDWSSTLDWDRTPPGPEVPENIVEATRQRYTEVYERITGETWTSGRQS